MLNKIDSQDTKTMMQFINKQNEGFRIVHNYACDLTVECAGDGWDTEQGSKVHVTGISVIKAKGYGTSIVVTHDGTEDIHNNSGFEAAISEAVGYDVKFGESDMQSDGESFPERI